MPLTARTPETIRPRLKLFMYGEPGVGKTTAALAFPRAYVIDAERGTDHYADAIRANNSVVLHSTSHSELLEQVRALLSERHDYRTLVIDPISTIYSDLLDECEKRVGESNARHYGEAQKHMKRLSNLLTQLDMNVVVTAHAKPDYGPNMTRLGTTFDGWRRLPYVFDVVIELLRVGADKRNAKVLKSRLPEAFPDGACFPWSYAEIQKRHGADTLERGSEHVDLASAEQIQRVHRLLRQLSAERIEALKIDRWFAKAGVSEWADMPFDVVSKCLKRLEQEILAPSAAAVPSGVESSDADAGA